MTRSVLSVSLLLIVLLTSCGTQTGLEQKAQSAIDELSNGIEETWTFGVEVEPSTGKISLLDTNGERLSTQVLDYTDLGQGLRFSYLANTPETTTGCTPANPIFDAPNNKVTVEFCFLNETGRRLGNFRYKQVSTSDVTSAIYKGANSGGDVDQPLSETAWTEGVWSATGKFDAGNANDLGNNEATQPQVFELGYTAGASSVKFYINVQAVSVFEGHTNWVTSVAFSSDDTKILSGSSDRTIKLWNTSDGTLIRTFSGHTKTVRSVAFSSDDTKILSGSSDKSIKLWDASNGTLIRTFTGHTASVYSVAFSSDDTKILSGSDDNTIRLWDASDGTLIRTFTGHTNFVFSVAFSSDDTKIVSGSWDRSIKLWNTSDGTLIRTFTGHAHQVYSVAFSSDDTKILSGSLDNTIKLWNASDGTLIRTFNGHTFFVYSVAFSSDDTKILSGSADNTIKLWDASDGTLIRTFEGHTDSVRSVAFSSDNTKILSGSFDNTTKLWSTE